MQGMEMGINLVVHLLREGAVSISMYSRGLYRPVFDYIDRR